MKTGKLYRLRPSCEVWSFSRENQQLDSDWPEKDEIVLSLSSSSFEEERYKLFETWIRVWNVDEIVPILYKNKVCFVLNYNLEDPC